MLLMQTSLYCLIHCNTPDCLPYFRNIFSTGFTLSLVFSASCCPKLSLAEKSDPQGLGLAAGTAGAAAPALTVSLPFCPGVLTQRTIWEEVLGDEHFLWIWQRPCGCKTLQVICKVSLSRHLNHLRSGKLLLVVTYCSYYPAFQNIEMKQLLNVLSGLLDKRQINPLQLQTLLPKKKPHMKFCSV